VVVVDAYDLGKSPFAISNTVTAVIKASVRAHNDALKIAISDLGNNVYLYDREAYVDLVISSPSSFLGAGAINNTAVCTVAANLCNTSTLLSGANAANYVFADGFYFTPVMQRVIGNDAYSKIRNRW
jgi:outer membrane lipase/esterase